MRRPKKPPSPFESEEAKEAFRQALRSAFAAQRALTDFIEETLHARAAEETLDAITAAAAAARDAEAAWSYFLRISHKAYPDKVVMN